MKVISFLNYSKTRLPYLSNMTKHVSIYKDRNGNPPHRTPERWGYVYDSDNRLVVYTPDYIVYDKFKCIGLVLYKERNDQDVWSSITEDKVSSIVTKMKEEGIVE